MSVYSSTDQINILKNVFTPEFQFGAGGYFQPTVKTYLPGNVEIGDPTTNYRLTLNGNSLATDLSIASWSVYPAISTLSMGSNSITNVNSVTFVGGNSFVGTTGTIRNLAGVQTINGNTLIISSACTFGTDKVYIGLGAGGTVSVSDVVAIGQRAGANNASSGLVAIGTDAAFNNSGSSTVAIGISAGFNNKGNANVFVGPNAGSGILTAFGGNIAIGSSSGTNANLSECVMLGTNAGASSTTGRSYSIGIGTNACSNGGGGYGVGIGYNANLSGTGDAVVAIGYNAGASNSGTNCIFLGSNALGSTANTSNNAFLVYSTVNNTPFLQGDMSGNTLGIGQVPVPGFGLTVNGAVQNTLSISTAAETITLTSNNASTRFFVSDAVTLVLPTTTTAGIHWVVTNTTSSTVIATISTGSTVYDETSLTLPAVTAGVGRQVTIAYSGTGTNFYAF